MQYGRAMRRWPSLGLAGAAAWCALVTGCAVEDCGDPPSSNVVLNVPSQFWSVDTFCVDDTCLTASQRVPVLVDPEDPLPYGYAVEVSVSPREHQYRIVVTSPDGVTFSHEGDVKTERYPTDECRPNIFNASLSIDHDGELGSQSP